MLGVIQGFTLIGVVIGVGVLLAYTNWLGDSGERVLNKLAFWVATPALMFSILSSADLAILASPLFIVTAVVMVFMGILYAIVGAIAGWGAGPTTIGAMASSFVNSANLGIPIAVYVLGDVSLVAPMILTQQLIMSPVILAILDISRQDPTKPKPRVWRLAARPLRNPVVIASLSGLALSALGIEVPPILMDPIELIGGMSIPAVLLAFGMSLRESTIPLRGADRGQVMLATVLKTVVHPLVAWAFGVFVFGMEGTPLLAVVVTAALPAAQNTFNFASEYEVAVSLARETVLITTLLSVPALFLVTVLLLP